ncbi:MAG: bifunctional 23S rRNA (guanine(2069)-N(7))-methyltransferase RlmK/23S rRNA (guanine(2445)-N(2))-methyltransferase RlmL, partial [Gammaproteobacteria bacterium]|nr:bifunctional 23S rRNA (guanine(2069)-N(7))-methyltransferase RlmK/23S rRNA (guanine(2445)-N(2))-methyltransferase RlmL [Gammaproteobacteria bacterium]
PPYGERLGDVQELVYVYADLGECLRKNYAEWSAFVFTGNEELAKHVGLRSHKSNTLFNGAIKCKLYHYTLRKAQSEEVKAILEEKDNEARQMIINRLKKNHKHLSRWAKRNNIECYRLYDADLPEFSAAIDLYNEQVLVQEYQAPSTIDIRKARLRFSFILDAVEQVLGVAKSQIVVKTRQQQKGLTQYEKQADQGHEKIVNESGLKFIVNLQDYLDTGLFLDHRGTRQKIREWVKGKHFLNLFAYTGSVSVYAAAGGAASTTTIDMSNTYLKWAQKNFKINQIETDNKHQFIKADCVKWLIQQSNNPDQLFDFIFLDPPTFSNSKTMDNVFDVQKDHVFLIQAAMKLLNEKGKLLFSNNFRKFKLDSNKLPGLKIENITQLTMPEDFKRNSKIHQCWLIEKAE